MTSPKIFSALISGIMIMSLSACKTISHEQAHLFEPQSKSLNISALYEEPSLLPTKQFISDLCAEDCVYELHPQTYNDGFSNSYKLTYQDHLFVAQGTDAAVQLVEEIKAVSALEERGSVEIAGRSVWQRTRQLAMTPYDLGVSLKERVDEIQSVSDAVLFLPETGIDISSDLIGGAKELGLTAIRLTENLSQTTCEGLSCAQGIVEDLWYGLNVLTGKHKSARDFHRTHGTDPETQNPLLKREIDRHAYVSSLSNTAFKYGLGATKVPEIANTSSAIGYYRNTAFLGRYEDARKQETADKKRLKDEGVSAKMIGAFYSNSSLTRDLRGRLIQSIFALEGQLDVTQTLSELSQIQSRHQARNMTEIYEHIAQHETLSEVTSLSSFAKGVTIDRPNGTRIYMIKADYLTWSKEMAEMLKTSEVRENGFSHIVLYVLGPVSETVKLQSRLEGIALISE